MLANIPLLFVLLLFLQLSPFVQRIFERVVLIYCKKSEVKVSQINRINWVFHFTRTLQSMRPKLVHRHEMSDSRQQRVCGFAITCHNESQQCYTRVCERRLFKFWHISRARSVDPHGQCSQYSTKTQRAQSTCLRDWPCAAERTEWSQLRNKLCRFMLN